MPLPFPILFVCHSERSEESPHWPLFLPLPVLAVVCSSPLSVLNCHPERSLARTLRQTQSKDLRLSVLFRSMYEAVILSEAARVLCGLRSRRTPMNSTPPQPPTPFSHKTPALASLLVIPQPSGGICFCFSFRSPAEESAFVCHSAAQRRNLLLFLIPQRSGGICFFTCSCLFSALPEGAGGFSPLNNPRRIKGLQPRAFFSLSDPSKTPANPLVKPSDAQKSP